MLYEYKTTAAARQTAKTYRDSNKETIAAKAKAKRSANPSGIAEKEKAKVRSKVWRDKNSYNKNRHYKIKYGISVDEFHELIKSQNNNCVLCGNEFVLSHKNTKPHLDHCHETNTVRGALCNYCNLMIGYAKDNRSTLANAIAYLTQSENYNANL
jgi:hypothetical protein